MHDLNTIRRLNAEAHADSIRAAQAAGKHVVATYAGLHLMTTQAFDDEAAALAELRRPCEAGDSRAYFPAKPAVVVEPQLTLDQLAALGNRSVGDPEPEFLAAPV